MRTAMAVRTRTNKKARGYRRFLFHPGVFFFSSEISVNIN
jgi:hypothetical protein